MRRKKEFSSKVQDSKKKPPKIKKQETLSLLNSGNLTGDGQSELNQVKTEVILGNLEVVVNVQYSTCSGTQLQWLWHPIDTLFNHMILNILYSWEPGSPCLCKFDSPGFYLSGMVLQILFLLKLTKIKFVVCNGKSWLLTKTHTDTHAYTLWSRFIHL